MREHVCVGVLGASSLMRPRQFDDIQVVGVSSRVVDQDHGQLECVLCALPPTFYMGNLGNISRQL